ncbi:MAG: penicillin-binding protein 2 [Dehalococcoidia bacterium]|nr:penicillin-binding protein 2 [Dehalococcoidia bacterium]
MGYSTGRRPWRSEPWRGEDYREAEASAAVKQKVFFFALLVIFVFGILTLQLARLQLVNGEKYRLRAENNRLRQAPIIPTRGLIYDRNGVTLVENRATFAAAVVAADIPELDVTASPSECAGRCQEITIALQELTGVPASDIEALIVQRSESNDPFTPAIVKDNLTEEQAFVLRERLAYLPGVRVVIEPRRQYTEGLLMAHTLGFVGRIDAEEYAELAANSYQLNDYLGKAGVELTYEAVLRGIPGSRDVETDASGRELRVLAETPSQPGNNVVLSIDLELQRKTTEFLQAAMGRSKNAAAIVIDVKTGELLSMASLPSYDNNIFTGRVDDAALQALLTDEAKPLLNHAIAEMYPPGSTFKQITGLAALQEGIAHANTQITSLGYLDIPNQYNPGVVDRFRDWAALGTLNFYRGVAMSSDVYFYYLAGGYAQGNREIFQGLGATRLADWTRRFGLGDLTGIDLPGESAGLVPDPEWKEKTIGEPWVLGDTYHMGIGQGFVTATPLQMAVVTAAVANGGDVLIPHVVKEIRDPEGNVIGPQRQNVRRNLNVDPRNLTILREGMRQAVADGTAKTSEVRGVPTGGKTGTAEFGERRPDGSYQEHGWFTGFAPFNNPEIAVVVFLEQGNGAATAAPVAAKIMDYYYNQRNVAQRTTP